MLADWISKGGRQRNVAKYLGPEFNVHGVQIWPHSSSDITAGKLIYFPVWIELTSGLDYLISLEQYPWTTWFPSALTIVIGFRFSCSRCSTSPLMLQAGRSNACAFESIDNLDQRKVILQNFWNKNVPKLYFFDFLRYSLVFLHNLDRALIEEWSWTYCT